MPTLLFPLAVSAATGKRDDQILIQGKLAGSQIVTQQGANAASAEFSLNDRGRGDHIVATWKLDAAGVPSAYTGRGNDYMKAPVAETFARAGAKATWRNQRGITGNLHNESRMAT
jgi:hypothetical protein